MSDAADAALQALNRWVRATAAYAYTVDAIEYTGTRSEASRLDITVDERGPSETVNVVSGPGAGSVVMWTGVDRVRVRPPGVLHALRVGMSVRDPKILSLRGNDIRTGVLSRVVACYAAHAQQISIEHLRWNGEPATALTVNAPSGLRCGPEDGDSTVTRDRVVVSDRDEHPLLRERYVGSMLAVRWIISNLRATTH